MDDEKDFPKYLDSLTEEISLESVDFIPIKSLKEIVSIIKIQRIDLSAMNIKEYVDLSGTQRRTIVRDMFAQIEALTYCLKQVALEYDETYDRKLTVPERMAINEEIARIDDGGSIQVRSEYPTVTNNIRFAFNILEKVSCSGFKLDVGTKGWEAFKKLISIRNRISHPRKASDLDITESEIASTITAYFWFGESLVIAIAHVIKQQATIQNKIVVT